MPTQDVTNPTMREIPIPGMPETPVNPAAYDPNTPQPYTPPATSPDLPPVPPPVHRDFDTGSAQQNVRPVFGGGKTGAIGTFAYLGDAILRGYMKGKQAKQEKQFQDTARLLQGMQYSVDNDANK